VIDSNCYASQPAGVAGRAKVRGRDAIAPDETMKIRNLLAGTITVAVAAVGAWWLLGQRSPEPSAAGTPREATAVEARSVAPSPAPGTSPDSSADESASPATQSAPDESPELAASEPPTEATALPELLEVPAPSAPPVGDELVTVPNGSAPRTSGQPELELLPQPPPVTPSPDELSEAVPSDQGNTSTR
jgi:hypothetical protein